MTREQYRARQTKALIAMFKSRERSLDPIPIQETECECEVRILESVLSRYRLALQAGMIADDTKRGAHFFMFRLEERLVYAKRMLRFERGDY